MKKNKILNNLILDLMSIIKKGKYILFKGFIVIDVDYKVTEEDFKTIELKNITVMNRTGDYYDNVADYLYKKLEAEISDYNDDNEEEWLDTLTHKEKQQYLKECYGE